MHFQSLSSFVAQQRRFRQKYFHCMAFRFDTFFFLCYLIVSAATGDEEEEMKKRFLFNWNERREKRVAAAAEKKRIWITKLELEAAAPRSRQLTMRAIVKSIFCVVEKWIEMFVRKNAVICFVVTIMSWVTKSRDSKFQEFEWFFNDFISKSNLSFKLVTWENQRKFRWKLVEDYLSNVRKQFHELMRDQRCKFLKPNARKLKQVGSVDSKNTLVINVSVMFERCCSGLGKQVTCQISRQTRSFLDKLEVVNCLKIDRQTLLTTWQCKLPVRCLPAAYLINCKALWTDQQFKICR